MSLPESRNRTFNAASPFYSDDANGIQDWLVNLWRALFMDGLHFADDFMGAALPPSSAQWVVTTGIGSQTQTRDDADAFGVLVLRPAAGDRDKLKSHQLWLTGKTFRLTIRARLEQPLQAGDEFAFGLGGWAGSVVQFRARHGHPTYELIDDGGAVLEDTNTAADTTYHLFELRCDGTNISGWVDGVKFYEDAAPNPFRPSVELSLLRDAGSANPDQAEVDFAKLWVATR